MRFAKASETNEDDIERPDIAEVLAYYGVLSRKRMVPCPLHEDKTPSCSVNYSKGVWNCHSCGEGGTSWDLIMLKQGLDFKGAKEFAKKNDFKSASTDDGERLAGSRYGSGRRTTTKRKPSSGKGGYTPSWRRR